MVLVHLTFIRLRSFIFSSAFHGVLRLSFLAVSFIGLNKASFKLKAIDKFILINKKFYSYNKL